MDISKLRNNLDVNSIGRISEANREIQQMLDVRQKLREILYNTELNYWEEAIKIISDNEFCQIVNKDKLFIFYLLYVDIRRNGLKFPILIQRKRDDGYPLNQWVILNGCHRMAIAKSLGIDEIPVKFIDPYEET